MKNNYIYITFSVDMLVTFDILKNYKLALTADLKLFE